MTVPNHQYGALLTLDLTLDEQVEALIERVLDATVIEQDDEAAKALITLIGAVAGEECSEIRAMIAFDVSTAIYARTDAFYREVKAFSAGARAKYLTPRGTPRNGKRQLSQAV
ncbi:MAG TPA: hypothetical protein VFV58_24090 [Blastocatellia bacterium]|jgi:hypothetical protein|nr:hypothetical protein [Blastocatellia bacterium]